MAKKSEIEGLKELERTIKKLGQLPQKCVTKAARQGANVALRTARLNAPIDSGDLRKGIVLKGEKSRIRGRKVFQVTFDSKMNDVFVKESNDGKRAYYPASQEFGFITKSGRYVPGYRFMRHSIEGNEKAIEKRTIEVLSKEIDKLK